MERDPQSRRVFVWSLVLAGLVLLANGAGFLMPEVLYAGETDNWYAQSVGQDMADLFIVLPALIISSWLAYRQSKRALLVRAGVLVYLIYTFVIYCFDVPFNRLFLVYCLVLGIAVYLFLWFLLSNYRLPVIEWFSQNVPYRLTGIFMIITGAVFYLLWLLSIIPAIINNEAPKELGETGLLTNPVHVLDLSVVLPGIILTGVWVMKRHRIGLLMTPVMLTFFVLMDITIGMLMIIMQQKGLGSNKGVMIVMFVLAMISLWLLIWWLRGINKGDHVIKSS